MGKRLISTGTTDNTGRITIPYTGTGAGKLQLVAESGSLTSETYELMDAIFYDKGTLTDYSSWTQTSSDMEMTRLSQYTELKRKDDAVSFGWIKKTLSVTDNFCVEFDFRISTQTTSNISYFTFRKSNNLILGISRNYQNLNDGNWHHYKLLVNGTAVTPIIDGEQGSNLTLQESDPDSVQLEAREEGVNHFKNFMVYPI